MHSKTLRIVLTATSCAALLCWAGCDSASDSPAPENLVNASPPGGPGGPPPPGGPGPGGPGPGGRNSPIRKIMVKLDDRNPGGLTKAIAKSLEPQPPEWPALEKQAVEYVQLTGELGKLDPPRGSKESWQKLTSAFHETATDLEKAVGVKNRDDALAASGSLSNSCMGCHREHRRMPGGGFGPRGGGGFPPGGGPPAGGGPPPGGGPPAGGPAPPGR